MRSFRADFIPHPRIPIPLDAALARPSVDVEIGAGQGLHAIAYARQNPDRQLIAIERTHTRFRQLERRRTEHPELTNLFPVHADALSVFVHQIPDQSIGRIFLLYPNPYPKEKQANLRWHNMPFMSFLKTKLKPGGELILATNIETYVNEAERQMISNWRFQLSSKRLLQANSEPRTHFEKKYLQRGQSCWNLVFTNPGQAPASGRSN